MRQRAKCRHSLAVVVLAFVASAIASFAIDDVDASRALAERMPPATYDATSRALERTRASESNRADLRFQVVDDRTGRGTNEEEEGGDAAGDANARTQTRSTTQATSMTRTTARRGTDDSDSTVTDDEGKREVRDADETFEESGTEKAADAAATVASVVATRLKELKGESSEKQKAWLEKVRIAHEVEGAASFTESESACGRAGQLAVYTIWNHVREEIREAIVAFMMAPESESTSPHSLLALRAKTARVVRAYDIKFAGEGEKLRECIGNYYVRRRVHEVLETIEAQKEARGEVEKDETEEEARAEQVRIGRVAAHLKKAVMTQIAPAEKFAQDDNVGGVSLVMALNCRAKHSTRLLAAVVHALRARFGLGATDFTLVVGRNSVEDELTTLFDRSTSSFLDKRSAELTSATRYESRVQVCPGLPGVEGPPEPELSAMEKAMREAESHVLLEHQGTEDPTNPHHLHGGSGVAGIGSLPGMPQMFNGKGRAQGVDSGAREEARSHFGLNDVLVGSHNTDHLRSESDVRRRAYEGEDADVRGPVGFNAMPAIQDPLAGYLRAPARPSSYKQL